MDRATDLYEAGGALTSQQFGLQLLSSRNDAMCEELITSSFPEGGPSFDQPLTHYWTSCSHNSYIVGDQLTGLSSADVYKRLLLQGCRSLEIVRHSRMEPKTEWNPRPHNSICRCVLPHTESMVRHSMCQDCWDLRDVRTTWRANAPVVTHGHTFVTIETV